MKKKVLSLLLTLCLAVGIASTCAVPASAAAVGTTPQTAISLTDSVWYTRYWTNDNYDAKCYNKIVVPSNGYITFSIEKPTDSEGEVSTFDLTLYDSTGSEIWEGDKSSDKDIFNSYYTYQIGLTKGTYYMDIDPSFYIYSSSAPIETSYRYVFTKSNTWEVEKNNDFTFATAISLDTVYNGVLNEGSSDYDYFKVYLTNGQKYTVNFENINDGTSYYFYDPDRDYKSFTTNQEYDWYYGYETINGAGKTWTFTAQKTGYHYIKIYDWPDEDYLYKFKVSHIKCALGHTYTNNQDTNCNICGKFAYPGGNVLYKENGVWYHILNRQKVNDTSLVRHTDGNWYFVQSGKINFSKTGLVRHTDGKWYFVQSGKINFSKTGLVKQIDGKWYYVNKGVVNFSKTGLVRHTDGKWYFVQGGKINFSKTGLVQHTDGKWYFVQSGKINFAKTGLVKQTNGKWYYVKKGVVDFTKNGKVYSSGKYYTVKKGVVV